MSGRLRKIVSSISRGNYQAICDLLRRHSGFFSMQDGNNNDAASGNNTNAATSAVVILLAWLETFRRTGSSSEAAPYEATMDIVDTTAAAHLLEYAANVPQSLDAMQRAWTKVHALPLADIKLEFLRVCYLWSAMAVGGGQAVVVMIYDDLKFHSGDSSCVSCRHSPTARKPPPPPALRSAKSSTPAWTARYPTCSKPAPRPGARQWTLSRI